MQIYYFTRTGRSRKIAEDLAAKNGTTAKIINDGKNWSGILGYIKAAAMSVRGKSIPADYPAPPAEETVALVFPVWAGTFPPAVKTFVQEVGRNRIIAVPTSLGSTMNDRDGFAKVIDLVGKEIVAPQVL